MPVWVEEYTGNWFCLNGLQPLMRYELMMEHVNNLEWYLKFNMEEYAVERELMQQI